MKLLKFAYLGLGVALLVAVLWTFNFDEALTLVAQMGVLAFVAVCALAIVRTIGETVSWHMTLPSVPIAAGWLARLWRIRMVGEAFNRVLPAGNLGGEPMKVVLLKTRGQIDYGESVASLYLFNMIDLAGQVIFVIGALALIALSSALDPSYKIGIGIGVVILVFMLAALVLLPRWRLSARLGRFLGRRSWGPRIVDGLRHVEEIETQVLEFRRRHPRRFNWAIICSILYCVVGAVETYVTFWVLGNPISLADAVMIEGVVLLVGSVTFFIPANIGSQEGAYVIFTAALTGMTTAGLGVAIVRRLREIVLLLLGFAIGGVYSRAAKAPPE